MPTLPKRRRRRKKEKTDLRHVVIGGADYFIYWEQMQVGNSFFIPTLLPDEQVMQVLRPIQKQLGIRLEVRTRCEYGAYGARVWRVA